MDVLKDETTSTLPFSVVSSVGRSASIWKLGGLSLRDFGRKLWDRSMDDDILAASGELSFFALLAFFPMLLLITASFVQMAGQGTKLREMLEAYISHLLPNSASGMTANLIENMRQHGETTLLSIGVILLLWSASQGMLAVIRVLNATYDVEERREWWKRRLVAIGLTVLLMIFVIAALLIVIAGSWAAGYLSKNSGIGTTILTLWSIIQWPLVVGLLFVGFGWIYLLAPSYNEREWYWVAPGALTAVVLWLLSSWLFKLYIGTVHNYTGTYGSFGAVVVLMLWMYLTSLALMIGGEVNITLETAAASKGNRGACDRMQKRKQVAGNKQSRSYSKKFRKAG